MQQKITPNLWFDTEAEEAADFYTSVFKDSRIVTKTHYTEGAPREAGMVMTVEWELNGQRFVGINGGPQFEFDEAVSFQITCEDQDEVDYYWEKLIEGGGAGPVWVAQGQVRPVLAGRPRRDGRGLRRLGPEARRARDEGDARDEQAGHRRAAQRGRRRPGELTRPAPAVDGGPIYGVSTSGFSTGHMKP